MSVKELAPWLAVIPLILGFADARCAAMENREMYELKAASAETCWELAKESEDGSDSADSD